eukprot:gene1142-3706_t
MSEEKAASRSLMTVAAVRLKSRNRPQDRRAVGVARPNQLKSTKRPNRGDPRPGRSANSHPDYKGHQFNNVRLSPGGNHQAHEVLARRLCQDSLWPSSETWQEITLRERGSGLFKAWCDSGSRTLYISLDATCQDSVSPTDPHMPSFNLGGQEGASKLIAVREILLSRGPTGQPALCHAVLLVNRPCGGVDIKWVQRLRSCQLAKKELVRSLGEEGKDNAGDHLSTFKLYCPSRLYQQLPDPVPSHVLSLSPELTNRARQLLKRSKAVASARDPAALCSFDAEHPAVLMPQLVAALGQLQSSTLCAALAGSACGLEAEDAAWVGVQELHYLLGECREVLAEGWPEQLVGGVDAEDEGGEGGSSSPASRRVDELMPTWEGVWKALEEVSFIAASMDYLRPFAPSPARTSHYSQGLPPRYPRRVHEAAFHQATTLLHSRAYGPAHTSIIAKLYAGCTALWESGRQQCNALSCTGRPCVLPLGHIAGGQAHTSGFDFPQATLQESSQWLAGDPFTLADANTNPDTIGARGARRGSADGGDEHERKSGAALLVPMLTSSIA